MTKDNQDKIRLAIFASGSGTNAEAIMKNFQGHDKIEVASIVTNNPDAGVIHRAKTFDTEVLIIENDRLNDPRHALNPLIEIKIDWIILAGWLRLIPTFLVDAFPNRIVNIHPALLPKFGGKGMYGKRVHKAVHEASEDKSGITIHFVNAKFDDGEIIAQFSDSINPEDTPETIEQKVRALELRHYPKTIENLVLAT